MIVPPMTAELAIADQPSVVREDRFTEVVTFRGVTVWSSFREGRYRLVAQRDGKTRVLRLRSRSVPFDVDLGPDRRDRVVAVYSRCAEEVRASRIARGCDLYRYDFRSRREVRLASTARRGHSETSPSIWRSRVAFARYRDPRDTREPVLDRLYVQDAHGRETRVRGGTPAGASIADADGQAGRLDLVGTRLAFDWTYTADRCVSNSGDDREIELPSGSEVWMLRLGGMRRLVSSGCSDDGTYAFAPSLTVGLFAFVSAMRDRVEHVFLSASGGPPRRVQVLPPNTLYASTDGSVTALSRRAGERYEVVIRRR